MSVAMISGALFALALMSQADDRKAEAGRHLERGNAAFESGDATSALDAYRAAYDAFPSPKIFYNMAEAHRELGNLVAAATLYERVTAELPADSPLVQLAQDKLTEVDAQIGRLTVSTDPPGAKIEIAGREIGISPLQDVRVAAGSIEVRATFDGRSETQTVDVEAGGTRAIELALLEAPPPPELMLDLDAEVAAVESVDVETKTPLVEKWWFWTAVGVGVVALAGTAAAIAVSSGDDFRPMGELGTTDFDEWRRR